MSSEHKVIRPRRDWFTMQPRGACVCDGGTIPCPWCKDGCPDCSGVGWYRCYGCDQFENSRLTTV